MYPPKYVIVNGRAIVFSASIQHKDMVGFNEKCEGAGFINFDFKKDSYGDTIVIAKCYGKSESLGIESREQDSEIVTHQITNTF